MSQTTAPLPGFWRFAWLFWMQPITLHRLLRSLDIDPRASGWKLFQRRRTLNESWWFVRLLQMLLLITPVAILAVTGSFAVSGGPFMSKVAAVVGVLFGAAMGWVAGLVGVVASVVSNK
jgi:hypothetical protein